VLQLLVSANVVPSSLILSTGSVFVRSVHQLLVIAEVVPSSLNFSTLKMEAIRPSETPFLTRATRRHITEEGILQGLECPIYSEVRGR
jgi:hypothetical protein